MANAHIYTTVTGKDTNETIAAVTVTFPYLKKSHLEIRASGAGDDLATFKTALTAGITKLVYGTDYTVSDAGLITFIVAGTFANESVYQVQVKRNSDISARYVDFADGSVVTEANLDDAQKQQIYLTQEIDDEKMDLNEDGTIVSDITGDITGDVTGNVAGNLTGNSAGVHTGAVTGDLTGNADTVTNGVYTTNNLSVLAATTSAQLAGVISDETGSGALVFGTSPTLVTPALGTPASGVATNLSGTAAGLTAGTVTTNANLTGELTSVGNAAVVADDVVDEANLKVNNSPIDGYTLSALASASGGLTWSSAGTGTVTSVTAGAGMTQTGTDSVDPTLNVIGGDGITANANEVEVTVDGSTIELSASDGTGSVRIKDLGVTTAKLAADAVDGTKLADDAIDSEHYVDGSIDNAHIADDAIDSEHYVDGSIDTAHIADDAITGAKIADDAIDSEHYADGSIDNAHIADDAIDSEHYADGSIDNAHIADDAIDSEHYVDGSIDTAHIADDAITGAKIADDAIDSEHYTDGSIDNAHIADDAIDSEHYADGSIDTAHIGDDQVTADKLANTINTDIATGVAALPKAGGAMTGAITTSSYIGMTKGTDIASASPTVPTDGDYFNVTGTTTIGTITVLVNRHFFLQFDGALSLTHHATNLDLPGGASITTAAGDVAEFFSHTADQVQCVNYTKADGTSVVSGGGSGDVSKVGTPADSQVGVWTGDGTIEGTTNLIFDATGLAVGTSAANAKLTVEGAAKLKEQAAADGDTANYGQVWVRNATPNELWFTDDAGNDKLIDTAEICIAASDETTVLTSSNAATFLVPRKMKVTEVKASLTTKDDSNDTIVDVQYSSDNPSSTSSILDSSMYCTITGGDYVGSTTAFTGTTSEYPLALDSFIRVEIESSTILSAQKGLKVWLLGYWE